MRKTALFLSVLIIGIQVTPADARCFWKKKKKTRSSQAAQPVIRSAAMSRTACFGTCPVYTIELFSDGLLKYTGRANVPFTGIYEKRIPAAEVMTLLQELNSYRPDTCQNKYELRIADLPNIYYTITYKDSVKKIANADMGPMFFKEMATEFDRIGKADASWTRTSDLPKQ